MFSLNRVTSFIALMIMLTLFHKVSSQVILVRESLTQLPIADVAISLEGNSSVILLTNENGQVSLNVGNDSSTVIFRHPAYHPHTVPISTLKKNKTVFLSERITQIEEVKITANRWLQDKKDVVHQVVRVGGKEAVFNNPQTSADLIGQTGQVFIQKSQLGGGSPMIRGFSANSVLIVMDGIRINNAIFRRGNLQNVISIDPSALESTEVIFGPSSTLYGSDALGGVMHFTTLKPRYTLDDQWEVDGHAMVRYSNANHEKTVSTGIQLGTKRLSNVTNLSFSDYDDLRTGSSRTDEFPDFGKRFTYIDRINGQDQVIQNDNVNIQRFSGYHQFNAFNKLSYRLDKEIELSHTIYYTTTSDIPRYDRLLSRDDDGELRNAQWYYGPQFLLLNAVSLKTIKSTVLYDGMKITLSNQMVDESRHDRRFQSGELRHREERVDVYALNADLEKRIATKGQLFYGAEALINEVTSIAFSENIVTGELGDASTRYPDGGSEYSSLALYSSYNHRFSDKIGFDIGARYTYVGLNAKFIEQSHLGLPFDDIDLENQAVSGSVGAVLSPTKNFNWRILASSGFRAPNIDDIGKVFENDGSLVVPNEQLKPEYSINYETGFDWIIAHMLKLEASFYYSDLINTMVRRPFELNGVIDSVLYDDEQLPLVALVNTGEAYIWGYSLGIDASITQNLGFSGRLNFTKGVDEIEGVPLRHAQPWYGRLAVTYQESKWRAELFSHFQGKRAFKDLAPEEQEKTAIYSPNGALSWYTLNLRTAYQLTDHWNMTASVENILDKHYRPYSSGISAPGVNGILSVRYQF